MHVPRLRKLRIKGVPYIKKNTAVGHLSSPIYVLRCFAESVIISRVDRMYLLTKPRHHRTRTSSPSSRPPAAAETPRQSTGRPRVLTLLLRPVAMLVA